MNEIFKEDGIFDNLPSVSILHKIHFLYQDFNLVHRPCKEALSRDRIMLNFRVDSLFRTTVVEEIFKLGYFQVNMS